MLCISCSVDHGFLTHMQRILETSPLTHVSWPENSIDPFPIQASIWKSKEWIGSNYESSEIPPSSEYESQTRIVEVHNTCRVTTIPIWDMLNPPKRYLHIYKDCMQELIDWLYLVLILIDLLHMYMIVHGFPARVVMIRVCSVRFLSGTVELLHTRCMGHIRFMQEINATASKKILYQH